MNNGDRYVVNSQNTLYRIPSATCVEGDTITLNNTVVHRFFLINGTWTAGDIYTTSSYGTNSYICHVWDNEKLTYDVNFLILPATILCVLLFSIIYKWFIRMRG